MTSHRDTETPRAGEGFHSGLVYDRGIIRDPSFPVRCAARIDTSRRADDIEIDAYYPDLQTLYQDIHRNPELAFQEVQTAAKLASRLKALGYEVTTGVGRTGVVGLLKNGAGPTVMLRTELDALPVAEKTGVAFASTVITKNLAGATVPVMHACGHDLHMTAWSGTAKWMVDHRQQWHGTLMLVGQPAEESERRRRRRC